MTKQRRQSIHVQSKPWHMGEIKQSRLKRRLALPEGIAGENIQRMSYVSGAGGALSYFCLLSL